MRLVNLIITSLFLLALLMDYSNGYYIDAEKLGVYLIPYLLRYSGRRIFNIGKMIGAQSVKNHGIHGGPIHHVFPKTYHPSSLGTPGVGTAASSISGGTSPYYRNHEDVQGYHDDRDYDEDRDQEQRPPRLHKNVVDAHYSSGMHYHYTHDRPSYH